MLPIGKLPADLLARLLEKTPVQDPQVLLGPGIGVDCAVIDAGSTLLVVKSDPITFTTEDIGWYAVQVNCNDIATTGATPRWFLATLLLPENGTTPELVENIFDQLSAACKDSEISLVGGHTEITYGVDRPILMGTLIGEVERERLVTPRGARPGDRLLLTKGVPIEATAILAREFGERLRGRADEEPSTNIERINEYGEEDRRRSKPGKQDKQRMVKNNISEGGSSGPMDYLSEAELERARDFLYRPGISVLREARIATQVSHIHAMHDPTEGGIYTALWEMSQACGHSIIVNISSIPTPELSARICQILGLDPLAAIASGSLLLATGKEEALVVCAAIRKAGISCTDIGEVIFDAGEATVRRYTEEGEIRLLPRPPRDAIATLFEKNEV
jgi:hydrogenase expression/formation protein HypE